MKKAHSHPAPPAAHAAELHGQSDLLTAVLGLAPAFISYVGLDCRYKLVSRHYLAYFGRPLDQIIGKEMREVIGEEAWTQVAPSIQRALQGETSHFQAQFQVPGRGARWSQGTYTPDFDSAGAVRGVVVCVNDITEQKRYEQSLKDKDAFYRSIFESPGIANIEAEPKTGRVLRVNRTTCEMLGYSEAELLDGRTFLDIIHPDDRSRNWQLVAPLLRGEVDHFRIEKRYLRKDGGVVWVNAAVTTLKDANGHTDRLLGAAQDITARVEAEQALRKSEERVRLAVAAAGIGYWTLDPKSGAGTLDNICAQHFNLGSTQTSEEVLARIIPADRERVRTALVDSFSGEHSYHAEFRIAAPDGSQRWLIGIGGALKDPAGTVTGISGVNIDISGRKVAEEEREKFVSLAANSSEFIGICESDGRILFLNEAARAMSGYASFQEAQSGRIWDLFFSEERDFLRRELFERAYTSGREEIETRIRNVATADSRWVMLNVFPIRDTEGQTVGLAVMGRDITERKNAERELTEAARRKDEFLATLAHELRNPLAPISNALQVWPRVAQEPAQLERIRQMMERQVQQLKHLIDDLLDVSRISQGKIQLRRESLDLASVLESAIESVRPAIDEAGHTITVHYPDTPVVIEGDRGRLNQIFGNLIHNSAKYSEAGGLIEVSVQLREPSVEVTVRDSGIGIPREMLAKIFEPFTQIQSSRGKAQGGIGIGLALVKNLVSLHGGAIEAHSEGLGKGSHFIVRLPLTVSTVKSVGNGAISESAHETPAHAVTPHRVLIVDDERSSADTLAMMLETLGQETQVAYNGQSALSIARSFQPEIVFSDIAMPGMDGFQLARELHAATKTTPTLVAVTGYGQEQDRRRTHEAGFQFHLVKPASLGDLREVLISSQLAAW
jgi:PAS domain S-box-containing protein